MEDTLIVIRTKWQDPTKEESIKVIRREITKEEVEVTLKINLRQAETVEIRPIKRPLIDIEGHIQDAERLANEPL